MILYQNESDIKFEVAMKPYLKKIGEPKIIKIAVKKVMEANGNDTDSLAKASQAMEFETQEVEANKEDEGVFEFSRSLMSSMGFLQVGHRLWKTVPLK